MTSKTSNIDEAVEAAFEPLRGNPQADRAAAVLSNLADYGLIWVVLAGIKARRRGPASTVASKCVSWEPPRAANRAGRTSARREFTWW